MKIRLKTLLLATLWQIIRGTALFIIAGSFRLPAVWAYLGIQWLFTIAACLVMSEGAAAHFHLPPLTRDAFYSAVSREYFEKGYIQQIEFLNNRMLLFLSDLLRNSKVPPIIILEGDHGLGEEKDIGSRLNNLLAIYFPDQDYSELYNNISPVNSLRIAFNHYLGEQMPLLQDRTYYSAKEFRLDFIEHAEEMPACF